MDYPKTLGEACILPLVEQASKQEKAEKLKSLRSKGWPVAYIEYKKLKCKNYLNDMRTKSEEKRYENPSSYIRIQESSAGGYTLFILLIGP